VGNNNADKLVLHGFLYDKVRNTHNNHTATIILHSTGCFIVCFSMANPTFASMVNRVVFIDAPFYGSDLANFLDRRPGANTVANLKLDTSDANIRHLCRGGETIWEMHHLPLNIPAAHIGLVIGTKRGRYGWLLPSVMLAYDTARYPSIVAVGMKDRYRQGLHHSDGIVPVTSQNLRSRVPDIPEANVVEIPQTHTGIQALQRSQMTTSRQLYNLLRDHLNAP